MSAQNPELTGAIRTFLGSLDFVYAATSLMRDDAPLAVVKSARQLGDYAMIREIGPAAEWASSMRTRQIRSAAAWR